MILLLRSKKLHFKIFIVILINQNLFEQITKKPVPECGNNKCFCNGFYKDKVYECSGCQRLVPWCFGGSDIYYDYCDDCANLLEQKEK